MIGCCCGCRGRWLPIRLRQRMKLYIASAAVVLLFLFFLKRKSDSNPGATERIDPSMDHGPHLDHSGPHPGPHFDPVNRRGPQDPGAFDYPLYTFSSARSSDNSTVRPRPPAPERGTVFRTQMSAQEKAIVFQIFEVLDAVTARYGLRYFLCGGTLLGSFRHHDLIPWDDDVDVYMNVTERDDIYSVLDALSPAFIVHSAGERLKLYSQFSHKSSRYRWRFPYIDINFFSENSTHIIDTDPRFFDYAYHKDTIYPLHRRPLGGLSPLAPRDTLSYLRHTYQELAFCVTTPYDHRAEVYLGAEGVYYTMCRHLRNRYPFVFRTLDEETKQVRETLMIGSTEIQSVVVDEPLDSISDVFRMKPASRRPRRTTTIPPPPPPPSQPPPHRLFPDS